MSAAEYFELVRLIEEVRVIAVEAQARADRALAVLLARASTEAARLPSQVEPVARSMIGERPVPRDMGRK